MNNSRNRNYQRIDKDLYETPISVIDALYERYGELYNSDPILEPSCGSGIISDYYKEKGFHVISNDIQNLYPSQNTTMNFLDSTSEDWGNIQAIITNPPYSLAQQFIEKSIEIANDILKLNPNREIRIHMLLNTDFDHAQKRKHLFGECNSFSDKLVLCNRIVWFPGPMKASPQFNHAWFTWKVDRDLFNIKIPQIFYHYKKGHHKHETPLDNSDMP